MYNIERSYDLKYEFERSIQPIGLTFFNERCWYTKLSSTIRNHQTLPFLCCTHTRFVDLERLCMSPSI